jgi:hypothetical protein
MVKSGIELNPKFEKLATDRCDAEQRQHLQYADREKTN